jgi:endonuclease/exonuclease/phosphatase (EEP) superfamily protein YafD
VTFGLNRRIIGALPALGLLFVSHASYALGVTECVLGLLNRPLANYQPVSDGERILSFGIPSKEAVDPQSIRVLQWNVFKGQRNGLTRDLDRLSKDSDIVALQEVTAHLNPSYSDLLPPQEGREWDAVNNFKDSQNKTAGVATGSYVKPTSTEPLISHATEPITHTPKVVLISHYKIQGQADDLTVINVHAINFKSPSAFKEQMLQIENAVSYSNGPMILLGDFNTWIARRTKALNEVAERLGLKEVTLDDDHRHLILDHAYVRGLDVKSAKIINDVHTSDHKPIQLEFKVHEQP